MEKKKRAPISARTQYPDDLDNPEAADFLNRMEVKCSELFDECIVDGKRHNDLTPHMSPVDFQDAESPVVQLAMLLDLHVSPVGELPGTLARSFEPGTSEALVHSRLSDAYLMAREFLSSRSNPEHRPEFGEDWGVTVDCHEDPHNQRLRAAQCDDALKAVKAFESVVSALSLYELYSSPVATLRPISDALEEHTGVSGTEMTARVFGVLNKMQEDHARRASPAGNHRDALQMLEVALWRAFDLGRAITRFEARPSEKYAAHSADARLELSGGPKAVKEKSEKQEKEARRLIGEGHSRAYVCTELEIEPSTLVRYLRTERPDSLICPNCGPYPLRKKGPRYPKCPVCGEDPPRQ